MSASGTPSVVLLADGLQPEEEFMLDSEEMMICGEEEGVFDYIVGVLEEIIVDETFRQQQEEFFSANCHMFNNKNDSNPEHMEVFQRYSSIFQNQVMGQVLERIPDFDMDMFSEMLRDRKDDVCWDVCEILDSFEDFMLFKELMISYKTQIECRECEENSVEMSDTCSLSVTVIPLIAK